MKKIIYQILALIQISAFNACDDFLDKEPLSNLTPEQYLTTEANVASYATDMYNVLPVHGTYSWGQFEADNNTDNMTNISPSDIYAPGYWKVAQTGGAYSFNEIYRCNYFFDKTLTLFESGSIKGADINIRHYIGEVYFFRAFIYFDKLKAFGDFPVVKTTLPDNLEALTAASKRAPCNEVARFILSDLDKAIELMQDNPPAGGKNRLNKDCARLFKSRVALYEGTWLKYFKGTAFVPNGNGWQGKTKDYNANYAYPSGDIDREIDYFLTQAMNESKIVADKYATLVNNTGTFQNDPTDEANPYFNMFGATDMNPYQEILLWKRYDLGLKVVNSVSEFASKGNNGYGTTKSMIDAFVMADGKPIYASSEYPGDANLLTVTQGRDSRAFLFFKRPGDNNFHNDAGTHGVRVEPFPDITATTQSLKYTTGYALRKGLNFDGSMSTQNYSVVGCIIFRAVEAYLNYMEACYEKTGSIDGSADKYWKEIRRRAKINEDYNYTIGLTDMDKEAETDWGAYSGGQLVNATLFNIRRERRCELMAEGFRPMDVQRWRSMDQMISRPYHVLGINLWENVALPQFASLITEGQNVSPESFSKYLAPYHIFANNRVYNGYRWNMAHYLQPIAIQHFLITGGGDASASPLYQNPGWTLIANEGPKE
ncbi:MAG: RagB/SusD family nutrient uptake outer membrane protein [Dysgonamonadaceae bacterium]|jgi:hypothetical protein|nr:RagB/SusD family nutrient uptake outer membrane protein [Dysgonamonadaceae bacterium]